MWLANSRAQTNLVKIVISPLDTIVLVLINYVVYNYGVPSVSKLLKIAPFTITAYL